jgi:hypothetical protein
MPTITVERRAADGPFRVGAGYDVAAGDTDEHFRGVVREVMPTGPNHVKVTVELFDAEYERLLASHPDER